MSSSPPIKRQHLASESESQQQLEQEQQQHQPQVKGKRSTVPLLIPELDPRIFLHGSERLTQCLRCDFALPDWLVEWGAEQKERNAGRVSGTRTLEQAMHEFKTIRYNEYHLSGNGTESTRRDDPNAEDACGCKDQCDYKCINRTLQIECTPELCQICARGVTCGNQRIAKADKKKIEPRIVPGKGIGLILCESIGAGQYVNEYVGEVITEKECLRRLAHEYAEEKHKYLMNMSGGLIIDATRRGNVARFINHSCDPNCRVQEWKVKGERRMGIFSIRAIEAGEELSFDYNFQRFGEGFQACQCGAASCRGLLGNKDEDATRANVGVLGNGDGDGGGSGAANGGVDGANGGAGHKNAVVPSRLIQLFPRRFFIQQDAPRKVETFILDALQNGLPKQDVEFARSEGIFLVRNVRKALVDEYLNQA